MIYHNLNDCLKGWGKVLQQSQWRTISFYSKFSYLFPISHVSGDLLFALKSEGLFFSVCHLGEVNNYLFITFYLQNPISPALKHKLMSPVYYYYSYIVCDSKIVSEWLSSLLRFCTNTVNQAFSCNIFLLWSDLIYLDVILGHICFVEQRSLFKNVL